MSKQDIKEIQKLININEDACEFYESAQEKVKNPNLHSTFHDLEQLHKNTIINLKDLARKQGKSVDEDETLRGQMGQFWGELMANISNDPDEKLVAHLEEAEDRCLHSIQDAIDEEDVSVSARTVFQQELVNLRRSHDHMKALKDRMKAA